MLSGAYFILKYILGKVSTNRQRDLNEKAGSNSAIMWFFWGACVADYVKFLVFIVRIMWKIGAIMVWIMWKIGAFIVRIMWKIGAIMV